MVDHAEKLASGSYDHIALQHRLESKQINLNIILLRFEDIQKLENIVPNYFPGLHLLHKNSGEAKWYADKYMEFLKTYKPLQYEIDAICGGDTLRFYSNEERHALSPECDPSVSFNQFHSAFESSKLLVTTSNTDLLVADLS